MHAKMGLIEVCMDLKILCVFICVCVCVCVCVCDSALVVV